MTRHDDIGGRGDPQGSTNPFEIPGMPEGLAKVIAQHRREFAGWTMAAGPAEPPLIPLLHTVEDSMALLSVSRSRLYDLIGEGRIRPCKLGRRTMIARAELERFVSELEGINAPVEL